MYYRIIKANDLSTLESLVNEAIRQGYVPTGGLAYSRKSEDYFWAQAMILVPK